MDCCDLAVSKKQHFPLGILLYVANGVTLESHKTMYHLFTKILKLSKSCLTNSMRGKVWVILNVDGLFWFCNSWETTFFVRPLYHYNIDFYECPSLVECVLAFSSGASSLPCWELFFSQFLDFPHPFIQ